MKKLAIIICLVYLTKVVLGDVPTNCTYEETVGAWTLYVSSSKYTNEVFCNFVFDPVEEINVELAFPNIVTDDKGNQGTWTMVYNQGFEIQLNGRSYFAFQYARETKPKVWTSYCDCTFNGYVHDLVKNNEYPPKNWACYNAKKKKKIAPKEDIESHLLQDENVFYGKQYELVAAINSHQSSWKATVYPEYEKYTIADMIRRSGGKKKMRKPFTRKRTESMSLEADALPEQFDWRNKSGDNFVSPVRNQGKCGSCYAFASMGQLEAGVRIQTNGRIHVVLSTQDVVSCSHYSQGCDGGFPYLIAGRYGQDIGVVTEDCYPYEGKTTQCKPKKEGTRIYVSKYGYVGGYYGGCNEALMRTALLKYGPLSVGIEVGEDFMHYKSGIYHKTGLTSSYKFNPFEMTNHAVLVVGYGVENGEKYWIVKNSWGASWGEDGYFRIRRGTDEISIESLAVYAVPYLGH